VTMKNVLAMEVPQACQDLIDDLFGSIFSKSLILIGEHIF
jgi:hypothetical protein